MPESLTYWAAASFVAGAAGYAAYVKTPTTPPALIKKDPCDGIPFCKPNTVAHSGGRGYDPTERQAHQDAEAATVEPRRVRSTPTPPPRTDQGDSTHAAPVIINRTTVNPEANVAAVPPPALLPGPQLVRLPYGAQGHSPRRGLETRPRTEFVPRERLLGQPRGEAQRRVVPGSASMPSPQPARQLGTAPGH